MDTENTELTSEKFDEILRDLNNGISVLAAFKEIMSLLEVTSPQTGSDWWDENHSNLMTYVGFTHSLGSNISHKNPVATDENSYIAIGGVLLNHCETCMFPYSAGLVVSFTGYGVDGTTILVEFGSEQWSMNVYRADETPFQEDLIKLLKIDDAEERRPLTRKQAFAAMRTMVDFFIRLKKQFARTH